MAVVVSGAVSKEMLASAKARTTRKDAQDEN